MLCKESGNIKQREGYPPSLLCPYALQIKWKHQAERRLPNYTSLSLCSTKKVETSGREKTTYPHLSVSMICKENGNIRQREDNLPSLLYLYAMQRKWKHQAERRLPNFTSLSLCSAKKVETSGREDYLPSLVCLYALQIKWKHQAERRLPTFTSLSLCSANKVETSGRKKTT